MFQTMQFQHSRYKIKFFSQNFVKKNGEASLLSQPPFILSYNKLSPVIYSAHKAKMQNGFLWVVSSLRAAQL